MTDEPEPGGCTFVIGAFFMCSVLGFLAGRADAIEDAKEAIDKIIKDGVICTGEPKQCYRTVLITPTDNPNG